MSIKWYNLTEASSDAFITLGRTTLYFSGEAVRKLGPSSRFVYVGAEDNALFIRPSKGKEKGTLKLTVGKTGFAVVGSRAPLKFLKTLGLEEGRYAFDRSDGRNGGEIFRFIKED